MSQYRLTRRGKIVVVLLSVMLFYGIFQVSVMFTNKFISPLAVQNVTTSGIGEIQTTTIESQSVATTETQSQTQVIDSKTSNAAANVTRTDTSGEANTENSNGLGLKAEDSSLLLTTNDERNLYDASSIIYFTPDKVELSDKMKEVVDRFSMTAKSYPAMNVKITGVALRLIDQKKSEVIALERASVVKKQLLAKGIASERILIDTRIVDPKEYKSDEMQRALISELSFEGYWNNGK